MKLGALMLGAYRLIIDISFLLIPLLLVWGILLYMFGQCKFEVYFVGDKYCYFCLFSVAIGLVNLLSDFHPKSAFTSVDQMGFL
jgi:hypothetical protein